MAKKYLTEEQKVINRMRSEFSNLLNEFDGQTLDRSSLIEYVSQILLDSGCDSDKVINMLQKFENFDDDCKDEIMRIKVTLGY